MAAAPAAGAADAPSAAEIHARQAYRHQLKRFQHDLLTAGARARFESGRHVHRRARQAMNDRAAWREAKRRARWRGLADGPGPPDLAGVPGGFVRARPARDAAEAQAGLGPVRRAAPTAGLVSGTIESQVNDHLSDVVKESTQSEVSITALGDDVLAAWNDGETTTRPGPVGYGVSGDGGRTWVDGGALPVAGGVFVWTSDPVVTVNERTGAFYLAALITTVEGVNGIGVMKATMVDSGLVWGIPTVARMARDTLPDKPWIAADSLTGHLYVSYTSFMRRGQVLTDEIRFIRSIDDNRSWSAPIKLSEPSDDGLVQGSRPAIGPDGEVIVVWGAVDTSAAAAGLDFVRVCRSFDWGRTFNAPQVAASMYSNFGSGAPGFNRGYGIAYPSLAIDRSRGVHRGRIHVGWQETVNYYDDVPPLNAGLIEREPNGLPDNAVEFDIGQTVRGEIVNGNDIDHLAFEGRAGETVVFFMDSVSTDFDSALRLLCTDGETRLAYNSPVWRGRGRFLYHTLPSAGRYIVRIALNAGDGGLYRLRTGRIASGPERARDHRDVFTSYSDDGLSWSTPVRVNGDPGRYDNWLPEIAVSPDGRVYAAWYDWRDAPISACGGWSHVYLARSDDGGRSWSGLGPSSTEPTDWSRVRSNLEPNQGDYIGLFAGGRGVLSIWADGRHGSPDAFVSLRPASEDRPLGSPLAFEAIRPNPTTGAWVVELVLVSSAPAVIELYDLAGRRVLERRLHAPIPGRRVESLSGSALAPGVYVMRVRQGAHSAATRVAVVR